MQPSVQQHFSLLLGPRRGREGGGRTWRKPVWGLGFAVWAGPAVSLPAGSGGWMSAPHTPGGRPQRLLHSPLMPLLLASRLLALPCTWFGAGPTAPPPPPDVLTTCPAPHHACARLGITVVAQVSETVGVLTAAVCVALTFPTQAEKVAAWAAARAHGPGVGTRERTELAGHASCPAWLQVFFFLVPCAARHQARQQAPPGQPFPAPANAAQPQPPTSCPPYPLSSPPRARSPSPRFAAHPPGRPPARPARPQIFAVTGCTAVCLVCYCIPAYVHCAVVASQRAKQLQQQQQAADDDDDGEQEPGGGHGNGNGHGDDGGERGAPSGKAAARGADEEAQQQQDAASGPLGEPLLGGGRGRRGGAAVAVGRPGGRVGAVRAWLRDYFLAVLVVTVGVGFSCAGLWVAAVDIYGYYYGEGDGGR